MSLYRKYRPQKFSELSGQHHIKTPIMRQLEEGQTVHAYLFSGPRGVGKTTTARLLAKAVNCEGPDGVEPCGKCSSCVAITDGSAFDLIEIDAASHTGVDDVRDNIIERVRVAPTQLKKTVFIIDEVHMLSKSAFNALLKTLEEPPSSVMFILATTELHKIPDTIISRCQRYDFQTVSTDLMIERLNMLAKSEGVKIDKEVMAEVARRSGGSQRDAESLLGQLLVLDDKNITHEMAQLVMPSADLAHVLALVGGWAKKDVQASLRAINTIVEKATDIGQFNTELVRLLRAVLLSRLSGEDQLGEYTSSQSKTVKDLLSDVDVSRLRSMLNKAQEALGSSTGSQFPQLPLELASVDLCGQQTVFEAPKVQEEVRVVDGPGAKAATISVEVENTVAEEVKVEEEAKEAPAVQKPAENGNKTVDLETVQKYWTTFVKEVKKRHASLPLALEAAEATGVTGSEVFVRCQFSFYAETLNAAQNNELLSGILSEVLSSSVKISAVFETASTDPKVEAVVNAFGGEVVN